MPITEEQLARLIAQQTVPLRLWAGRRGTDGDDIVQEAFCRLVVTSPVPDRPVAWLYRVVRNLAETQRTGSVRRKKREAAVALNESVSHDPSQKLIEDEVLSAVRELEDPLREVVTARIWGELTFEEIGKLCEVSVATACRRYQDALSELRKQLETPCPTTNR